jgi:hypothetical protein
MCKKIRVSYHVEIYKYKNVKESLYKKIRMELC